MTTRAVEKNILYIFKNPCNHVTQKTPLDGLILTNRAIFEDIKMVTRLHENRKRGGLCF